MIEPGKVTAILLAAGRSHRFGGADKLMTELDGDPLLAHAARRIVDLHPAHSIAVCNDLQGGPATLLRALGFEIALNPHPERGLSHSLACGIGRAAAGAADAALICLADMPYVTLRHLKRLLECFDPVAAPIVASRRGDSGMPPAIFARSAFDRLLQARGDEGGRALLAGAALVEAPAAELADIDLPEDIRRAP